MDNIIKLKYDVEKAEEELQQAKERLEKAKASVPVKKGQVWKRNNDGRLFITVAVTNIVNGKEEVIVIVPLSQGLYSFSDVWTLFTFNGEQDGFTYMGRTLKE